MKIDSTAIHRYYASVSDEELLAVDRADLTAAAQMVYDQEVARRNLITELKAPSEPLREMPPLEFEPGTGDEWEGESAVATAFTVHPRELAATPVAEHAAHACEFLRAAGIPCSLHNEREPDGKTSLEVMIPVGQVLNARAVLDKEIYNPLFEAEWRMHFETLTDEEFGELDLGLMREGINDRVERLERAYRHEVARRAAARG
jgi:hypothetical protein